MSDSDDSVHSIFFGTSASSSSEAPDNAADHVLLKCNLCEKVFSHESTLRRHRRDHEAQKCRGIDNEEYICDICDKLFYFKRKYNAHMKDHHGLDVQSSKTSPKTAEKYGPFFECTSCSERFFTKVALSAHMLSHSRSRCNVREESFSSKAALTEHENGTNDEAHRSAKKRKKSKKVSKKRITSYESSNSEKRKSPVAESFTMTTYKDLDECMSLNAKAPEQKPDSVSTTATIEEPQRSDQTSTSNTALNRDQDSSTETMEKTEIPDTKNFNCTKCSRKFYTEETLQLHLSSHRELPQMHNCALCDFCSVNQFAFALHVLDHYKKKYLCDICNRSFYTKKTMELHFETHLPADA